MAEGRSRTERYFQAALLNAWNLGGLATTFGAAIVTGDTWIAGVGVALEAVWIAVATQSPRFRRTVDSRSTVRRRDEVMQKTRDELGLLPAHERTVVQSVATAAAEVRAECLRNPHLGGELLAPDLDRLETTVSDYVHLALVAQRCETYLARTDPKKIEREREDWRKQAAAASDEADRTLALRNVDVLGRRLIMADEIRRFAGRARTQMSLVQNTVALLRDQVLTISTPEAVAQELDVLVTSLDALRDAARDVESAMAPATTPFESVRTTEAAPAAEVASPPRVRT